MRVDWHNFEGEVRELLPLGGHGVTGSGLLPIQVEKMVTLMNVLAYHVSRALCDPLDCEDCNRLNALYWWLSDGLTIRERTAQQAYLRTAGVPLPPAPWEDAHPDGQPGGDE